MEKILTNQKVINLTHTLKSGSPNALGRHKLPIKMLLALHRSTPDIEAAYKAYEATLDSLCGQYGVTKATMHKVAKDKSDAFQDALEELLKAEVVVSIYPVDRKLLDDYNDTVYDPLSYSEIETLYMFTTDEKEDEKE